MSARRSKTKNATKSSSGRGTIRVAKQLPTSQETLLLGLGRIPLHSLGSDAKVPELFSGRCESPIWFVAENPVGAGQRPTVQQVSADPRCYVNYYCNRFSGLDLASSPTFDAFEQPISSTVQNHISYLNAFCEGAGIPVQERWRYLMKTNAIANHAPNEAALNRINAPVTLGEWVPELVRLYRPTFVVAFGLKALKAIQELSPIQLHRNQYKYFQSNFRKPTVLSFRSVQGWLKPNQERLEYLEYLGWHWRRYAASRSLWNVLGQNGTIRDAAG